VSPKGEFLARLAQIASGAFAAASAPPWSRTWLPATRGGFREIVVTAALRTFGFYESVGEPTATRNGRPIAELATPWCGQVSE
jgi:hypothetical protein